MDKPVVNIMVKEICGEHCVGIDDGQVLFKEIKSCIDATNKVLLDFTNISTITSSFLNASIGKLYGHFKNMDYLKNTIEWIGLDENDKQLFQLVIENAREHFEKPEESRKVEDDIVKKTIEEE